MCLVPSIAALYRFFHKNRRNPVGKIALVHAFNNLRRCRQRGFAHHLQPAAIDIIAINRGNVTGILSGNQKDLSGSIAICIDCHHINIIGFQHNPNTFSHIIGCNEMIALLAHLLHAEQNGALSFRRNDRIAHRVNAGANAMNAPGIAISLIGFLGENNGFIGIPICWCSKKCNHFLNPIAVQVDHLHRIAVFSLIGRIFHGFR